MFKLIIIKYFNIFNEKILIMNKKQLYLFCKIHTFLLSYFKKLKKKLYYEIIFFLNEFINFM